ncbi:MAG: hypothetical protein AABX85_02845 [Nanoarchaeota archaeon]
MTKPYVEAEVKGKRILRVDAPFDEALQMLRKEGVKNPMTSKELTYARTYHPDGKKSTLMTSGSYTQAGFVYIKGESPIRVQVSPLLDERLAKLATQENRENRYFSTGNTEMYEKLAKLAKEDKNKAPEKRRAIVLPSRTQFNISLKKNQKVFANIFGKAGEKYLEFLGFDSLTVYPVDKTIVDVQKGTILTQEWLARLGNASNVDGDDRSLGYSNTVRGVQSLTGEASSQKPSKLVLPYTVKEVDKITEIVARVKLGELPASKLEKVLQFANKLRRN